MRGLQNPLPVPGGKPEDVFFATRQVTRHYIAYHGASPDISGEKLPGANVSTYCATNRSLFDSYFPTYVPPFLRFPYVCPAKDLII
jgi:hypothetical protein